MSEPVEVTLSINGRDYPLRLEPRRIAAAEEILQGELPSPEVFWAAAEAAAAAIDPLEDPQTDAQYRRELAGAMVYRALMRACPPPGAQV